MKIKDRAVRPGGLVLSFQVLTQDLIKTPAHRLTDLMILCLVVMKNIYVLNITVNFDAGERGWHSGESASLPLMCPVFDS